MLFYYYACWPLSWLFFVSLSLRCLRLLLCLFHILVVPSTTSCYYCLLIYKLPRISIDCCSGMAGRYPPAMLWTNCQSIINALSINYHYAIAIRSIYYQRAINALSMNELLLCSDPRHMLSICYQYCIHMPSICECALNVLAMFHRHAINKLTICYRCILIPPHALPNVLLIFYQYAIESTPICYQHAYQHRIALSMGRRPHQLASSWS